MDCFAIAVIAVKYILLLLAVLLICGALHTASGHF